jgi:hypothetical protein
MNFRAPLLGLVLMSVGALSLGGPTVFAADDLDDLVIYEDILLAATELPPDVILATQALVLRIRGINDRDAESTVRFAQPAAARLALDAPRYRGFTLEETRIHRLAPSEKKTVDRGRSLAGTFTLIGPLGRRARMGFAVDYGYDDERIDVHDAAAVLLPPTQPEILAFVVPADRVRLLWTHSGLSHLDLLDHVAGAAVDPADPPTGTKQWRLFVFVMNQLPDDDGLLVYMHGAKDASFRTGNYLGWQVLEKTFRADLAAAGIPTLELWLQPGARHPPKARKRRAIAVVAP